jgi:hypothetical protein
LAWLGFAFDLVSLGFDWLVFAWLLIWLEFWLRLTFGFAFGFVLV